MKRAFQIKGTLVAGFVLALSHGCNKAAPTPRPPRGPTTQPYHATEALLKKASEWLDSGAAQAKAAREYESSIRERQQLVKALLDAQNGEMTAARDLPPHPITDAGLRVDSGGFSGQANLSWDDPTPFLRLAVNAGEGEAAAQSIAEWPTDAPRGQWLSRLSQLQLEAGDRAGALKTIQLDASQKPPPVASLQGWVSAVAAADLLSDLGDPAGAAKMLKAYPDYAVTAPERYSPDWMTVRAAQGDVGGALQMFRGDLLGYDVSAPNPKYVRAAVEIARRGHAKDIIDSVSELKYPFPVKLDVLLAVANMQRATGSAEFASTFALAESAASGKLGPMLMVERAARAAGDKETAANVRAEAKKLAIGTWSAETAELLHLELEAGDIDAANELAVSAKSSDKDELFKIAEAYIAAGKADKAIGVLGTIENGITTDSSSDLRGVKNLYRVVVDLKSAGADADQSLQKAESAAAVLPADLSVSLLPDQLKAGEKKGAAASIASLHARIAKAAASPNAFERDMKASNLRISEAEAYLAAGDLNSAVNVVGAFANPRERTKGYHRLADRLIDRAAPGIVGRID